VPPRVAGARSDAQGRQRSDTDAAGELRKRHSSGAGDRGL